MRTKLTLILLLSACCNLFANVVYVKTGGAGDGSSEASPVGNLTDAYNSLGDDGGTIVICGDFELTATSGTAFTEPTHTGLVTITQVYGGVDYRTNVDESENSFHITTAGRRFVLSGPTKFENINFFGNTAITQPFILFIANYNPITMGEGIQCKDFHFTQLATSPSILGGYQKDQGTVASEALDSHITIQSGKFLIVGFNRSITGPYTGTANINISGGEILNIFGGSASGTGGNLNLNISGGTFIQNIYASNFGANYGSGTANVTITGGDFSQCEGIYGSINEGSSAIDISNYAQASNMMSLISNFDKIITADGVLTFYKPNNVFDKESFTSSSGTVLPYRIWFPENYDPAVEYPLALYMHGNGSRGNDNETHLTTTGAALVTEILNSKYDCIILAPQCNTGTSWVSTYPGNSGYTVESVPMGGYLAAAKELLDEIIDDYSVNTDQIYIFGSSNGGGASWDLMCRFPDLFAAGVPMAGCGESSNAAAIADLLVNIPIWTFHGDKDETLSVEGTRGIVDAIHAAGGELIIYTEIEGGDHNIWPTAATTEGLVDWIFSQKKEDDLSDLSERLYMIDFFVQSSIKDNTLYIHASQDADIILYSLLGQKILEKKISAGLNSLSLNLPVGNYLLKVNMNEQIYTEKLQKHL